MILRFLALLLTLTLLGCGVDVSSVPPSTQQEQSTRAAMQNRLGQMLDDCLAAAKTAPTPGAAESAARSVFERWKRGEQGECQFHVQAQRLPNGGLQMQVQAQLTEGMISLQAQRQIAFGPVSAR